MSCQGSPTVPGKFCVLPWIHRFTNVDGNVQVCCTSEDRHRAILDDSGNPMIAPEEFDDELIMNSSFMKRLRIELLDGNWPDLCRRCEVTEQAGGISRRQSENAGNVDLIEELLENTQPDGTIPVRVRSMDMRLGNLCNLACRMCNPRSSSSWIRDWSKVNQRFAWSEDDLARFKTFEWYKSPKVREQLARQLPSLRHLHFAGGEPLIAPEALDFLKLAVDSGESDHINLTYNTNITKIPEEAKRLWPLFKTVKLFCSVDAYGALNEFIRHPSSWKTIDRNLRDLDSHFDEWGLKEVLVMTTVQVYNVLRLGELYDYLAANFKRVRQIPQTVELYGPPYFNIQILPPKLKDQAEKHLQDVLVRTEARISEGLIPSWQADILPSLSGTIQFLRLADRSELIPGFLIVSESMDRVRNQSLYKIAPELQAISQ